MNRVFNRRNALIGWAMWNIWRRRVRRKAGRVMGDDPPARPRLRKVVAFLAAVVATLGVVAVWRRLRGGADEWETLEPLESQEPSADVPPAMSSLPDDDMPPAA